MLDKTLLDGMFDAAMKVYGQPPSSNLMNPAFLMPLSDLPDAVKRETGRSVTSDSLERMALAEWFRVGETDEGERGGVMLIVPSRIGLLLDLRDGGWDESEIRAVALQEDEMIEWVFSSDDMAYVSDPMLLIAKHCFEEASFLREAVGSDAAGRPNNLDLLVQNRGLKSREHADVLAAAAVLEARAEAYERGSINDLAADERQRILRIAFEIELREDLLRLHLLNADRAKVQRGFSPFVMLNSMTWSAAEDYSFEDVHWRSTVRSPWLDESDPIIRLPGLVLRGTNVSLTRSPSPSDYQRLFKQFDIETYLAEWQQVSGERLCIHCHVTLPHDASPRRRYCGEGCRNAAKQARYRDRNPDAAFDNQVRYYGQFDPP